MVFTRPISKVSWQHSYPTLLRNPPPRGLRAPNLLLTNPIAPLPMTTSKERADRLGTEVYSRAIEICWRLDGLWRVPSGSAADFKCSDSTASIPCPTLQRLRIKIRDRRLHCSF